MQKRQPPSNVRPEFTDKAALTAEQKIAQILQQLPEKSQEECQRLDAYHDRAMRYFEQELEASHQDKVDRLARDILDQKMTAMKMSLKPKFLPAYSKQELSKQAIRQAEIEVSASEHHELSIARARFTQEQLNKIEQLELKQKHLEAFNRGCQLQHRSNGDDADKGNQNSGDRGR